VLRHLDPLFHAHIAPTVFLTLISKTIIHWEVRNRLRKQLKTVLRLIYVFSFDASHVLLRCLDYSSMREFSLNNLLVPDRLRYFSSVTDTNTKILCKTGLN
jgi:hypothetical protein